MNDKAVPHWYRRHPKLFFVLLAGSLFLTLDLTLGHFWCPKTERKADAFYHHDLPKNYNGPSWWANQQYTLITNSLGFKDSSVRQVPLESPRHRILILGDSFTEGVGIPYEETFAGIFASGMAGKGVEVLNAAVVSYSPKLYYLKALYLLQNVHLKFDELIIYIDYSDIQDEIRYEAFVPSTEFGLSRYWFVNRIDSFLRQHSLTYWKSRKVLLKYLGWFDDEIFDAERDEDLIAYDQEFSENWSIERNQWEYNQRVYETWGKRGIALAEENMERLYQLCREHGVRLTIAVYPWPNQIKRHDLASKQVKIWQAFCAARGISFLNYYPVFITDDDPREQIGKYFISGDVHWNRLGHQVVANVLLNWWNAEDSGGVTRSPESFKRGLHD